MFVDYTAIERVLGSATTERFREFCEESNDGYDAPGLICMAVERSREFGGGTVAENVANLLDAWDAR